MNFQNDGDLNSQSLGGQEDDSTQGTSNNLDLRSKARRTTSGGAFNYLGG